MITKTIAREALKNYHKKVIGEIADVCYMFSCKKNNSEEYEVVVGLNKESTDYNQSLVKLRSIEMIVNDHNDPDNTLKVDKKIENTTVVKGCSNTLIVQPGKSIGNPNTESTGSLGAILNLNNCYYLITCQHVLRYDTNDIGKRIDMPGVMDLQYFTFNGTRNIGFFIGGSINDHVDLAVGKLIESQSLEISTSTSCNFEIEYNPDHYPKENMIINFCRKLNGGLASPKRICSTDAIVKAQLVGIDSEREYVLYNQLVIENNGNTELGDSGSIAFQKDTNYATGLLFSHSNKRSFLNNISDVIYSTTSHILRFEKQALLESQLSSGFKEVLEDFNGFEFLSRIEQNVLLKEVSKKMKFIN